jgi:hypothetical protein
MSADALPFNPFVLDRLEHPQFYHTVHWTWVVLQHETITCSSGCLLVRRADYVAAWLDKLVDWSFAETNLGSLGGLEVGPTAPI